MASSSVCPVCSVEIPIAQVGAHVAECVERRGFTASSIRLSGSQGGAGRTPGAHSASSTHSKAESNTPSSTHSSEGGTVERVVASRPPPPSCSTADAAAGATPGDEDLGFVQVSGERGKPSNHDGEWTMMGEGPSAVVPKKKDAVDELLGRAQERLERVRSEMRAARQALFSFKDSPKRPELSSASASQSGTAQCGITPGNTPGGVQGRTSLRLNALNDDFGFVKVEVEEEPEVCRETWHVHGSINATAFARAKDRKQLVHEEMQKKSWANVSIPKTPPMALSRFRFLIRRGVPDEYRRAVWLSVTGYLQKPERYAAEYFAKREEVFGPALPHKHFTVPLFGCDALEPGNYYLLESETRVFQRVLCVLAAQNADVDYCPSIVPFVGLLLMYVREEEAFHIAQSMLRRTGREKSDANRMLARSMKRSKLLVLTFRDLVAKRLSALYAHLEQLGVDLVTLAEGWFSFLFVKTFPICTALRIFDVFLCEGYQLLFRVGLALLANLKGAIMRSTSREMAVMAINQLCMQYHSHDALIKRAYSFHFLQRHIDRFAESNKRKVSNVQEPEFQVYYRPHMDVRSTLAEMEDVELLYTFLPQRLRIMDLRQVYNVEEHGYSFNTFMERAEGVYPTVLLIKAGPDQVFGAYVAAPFTRTLHPYGSRDSFLFVLKPVPRKFAWKEGMNESFMFIDSRGLQIGAGGDGAGIFIDGDLNKGTSAHCDTYNNAPLCADREVLEQWHTTRDETACSEYSQPSLSIEASLTMMSGSPTDNFWNSGEFDLADVDGCEDTPTPNPERTTVIDNGAATSVLQDSTPGQGLPQGSGAELAFNVVKIELYTFQ